MPRLQWKPKIRIGDEVGFDEKIFLTLQQVHPASFFILPHYIGIVINSYSGQEIDNLNFGTLVKRSKGQ